MRGEKMTGRTLPTKSCVRVSRRGTVRPSADGRAEVASWMTASMSSSVGRALGLVGRDAGETDAGRDMSCVSGGKWSVRMNSVAVVVERTGRRTWAAMALKRWPRTASSELGEDKQPPEEESSGSSRAEPDTAAERRHRTPHFPSPAR